MSSPRAARDHSRPWALLGCGCAVPAVFGILVIFAMLWLNDARAIRDPRWSRQSLVTCETRLKGISLALESYTRDHQRMPDRLGDLVPRYLDAEELHCPLEAGGTPYRYSPAGSAPTDTVVTCTNHAHGTLLLLRNGALCPPRGW